MSEKNIAVVGSTNIDLIMQVPQLPAPGETVGDGVFSQALGGKGANQAMAVARLGGQVSFISGVGDDEFGEQAINALSEANVDTQAMEVFPQHATGSALIFVDQRGENSIGVAPGANGALVNDIVEQHRSLIERADFVLLQLEIPITTVRHVVKIAKRANTHVAVNAAPMNLDLISDLASINTLIVNQTELQQLTDALDGKTSGAMSHDEFEIRSAVKRLRDTGVDQVIVTLGGKGVYVADRSGDSMHAAYKVKVIDTTGAGDTFCGALVTQLAEQESLKHAVDFAQKAAALAVTALGAQAAIPHRKQVEQFQ